MTGKRDKFIKEKRARWTALVEVNDFSSVLPHTIWIQKGSFVVLFIGFYYYFILVDLVMFTTFKKLI